MRYDNKSVIKKAQHDIPGMFDINYSFDHKDEILKMKVSFSPEIKGGEAVRIWNDLVGINDVDSCLLESKKIASMICGIDRLNSKSRKPNYVYYRCLVIWYATRRLKFSREKAAAIFDMSKSAGDYATYFIEREESEMMYDQIEWRQQFMNRIKNLR